MPEAPPGYSARHRSGSRRLIIVASRHDLRLRTITRVPCGHSFFGAGSLNAGAGSVAAGAGCDAGSTSDAGRGAASVVARSVAAGACCDASSVGDAAAGWFAGASAISVSISSVVGAVLADFQTISNRPSSLGLMPYSTAGAVPLRIIASAARLAFLRNVKLEAVVSIVFSN